MKFDYMVAIILSPGVVAAAAAVQVDYLHKWPNLMF